MLTDQDLIFEAYNKTLNEYYNVRHDGAVNLLEQLKEEVPELEDKINQILGKVFDAVDILKQESYVDDPQLQAAHESLIEGNF